MRHFFTTSALLMAVAAGAAAQNNNADSSRSRKPIVSDQTKQELVQKGEQAGEKLNQEVEKSRNYQQRNQLSWFQPGNLFVGGGLGLGANADQSYIAFNARAGYFFQPGFMAGFRFDNDGLVGGKYHSRQFGVMARYYPFRTRISSFVGASLNGGREFSENIPSDAKAKYTSVGLEIGVMAWILHRLGAEISYESSFYNKIDPTVSRGKGNRLKLGVNYYFGRVGQRGVRLAR